MGQGKVVASMEHKLSVDAGGDQNTTTNDSDNHFDLAVEAKRLFHVGIPSVLVQFNLYFIFPTSASYVGRLLGTVELGAFSVGSLVGNLTCLSIVVGALTAADTLLPRAYGIQNYKEIGRLVIRAIAVCSLLLTPPIIILSQSPVMYNLLHTVGHQDSEVSRLAAYEWIFPYFVLGQPANMLFRVFQRFLIAQHQSWPPVLASIVPSIIIHPLLLQLLVPRLGLKGSALAIAITQWLMLFCLVLYMKIYPSIYHPDSFPSSWSYVKEGLTRQAEFVRFAKLSVGGVFSLSEWWFWESMCFLAGTFGVEQLSAHTIAYNIIPLCFMFPLGMSIGLSVRMGHVIAHSAYKARLMALYTMVFTIAIGLLVSGVLFSLQTSIIQLFTHDRLVIEYCHEIWFKVCYYIVMMYVFGINGAILRALGMQWTMAAVVFTCLWFLALPSIFYFAYARHGGFVMQWTLLPVFYTLMQLILFASYATVNWEDRSVKIRSSVTYQMMQRRSSASEAAALNAATSGQQDIETEETPLLSTAEVVSG